MSDSDCNSEEAVGRRAEYARSAQACRIPPRQKPYDRALELGFETLLACQPTDAKLDALGASRRGPIVTLPALNRCLHVGLDVRTVSVEHVGPARQAWAILAVHYLCAEDVSLDVREVSLNHFADCRGYLDVFSKRIIQRFLGTAGRSQERFVESSERLGGKRLSGSGVAYRFEVLPRVPIVIVRYEGDDELGPGASVTYRADAEHLLPAEDRIVAAELLVDALCGKPMEESV